MRISDWSSDVCSSDLEGEGGQRGVERSQRQRADAHLLDRAAPDAAVHAARAEPARIGRGPTDSEPQRQRRDERDQQGEREQRSEEHTSELQSLMRISYAVFCLKKKKHLYKANHIKK